MNLLQEVKRAVIAASGSGNNTLVAAVASRKIRVHAFHFVVGGAVDVRFESGAGTTPLTGVMEFGVKGEPASAEFSEYGHFETAVGALLNMELSGAEGVAGWLLYSEVPA